MDKKNFEFEQLEQVRSRSNDNLFIFIIITIIVKAAIEFL